VATSPLVLVVFFINDFLTEVSQSVSWIAFFLSISALLNFFSFLILNKKDDKPKVTQLENISFLTSLKIGLLQVLAVFPGVSRSGMTLFASLSNKIQAETAFKFSFLLSIPTILGALVFDLINGGATNLQTINWPITVSAMLVAFCSGLFSLKLLKGVLNRNRFLFFAGYCLFLSVGLLLFI